MGKGEDCVPQREDKDTHVSCGHARGSNANREEDVNYENVPWVPRDLQGLQAQGSNTSPPTPRQRKTTQLQKLRYRWGNYTQGVIEGCQLIKSLKKE